MYVGRTTAGFLAFAVLTTLPQIASGGEPSGTEMALKFASTFDKSEQEAVLYLPKGAEDGKKVPLLLHLHYLSGNRFTAKRLKYYEEADKRGWMILSPELHGLHTPGGQTSYAGLPAQHDAIDALEQVLASHKNIDHRRIFVAGRSMGGMLAILLAAKYPDRFAGVVAGQPITDAARWYRTSALMQKGAVRDTFLKEMGGSPEEKPFEYKRRSAFTFARNLKYLPMILWSGSVDTWVPPDQCATLCKAVQQVNPYQPDVKWLVGASHCPQNYSAAWVCDQLQYWENAPESGVRAPGRYYTDLDVVTDEAKSFFYLTLTPSREDALAEVRTRIQDKTLNLVCTHLKSVQVDLQLASGVRQRKALPEVIARYRVETDGPLDLALVFGKEPVATVAVKDQAEAALP